VFDEDESLTIIGFVWSDHYDDFMREIRVTGSCISAERSYLTPQMAVDMLTKETCHVTYCEDDYGMDGWLCDVCGEWFAATLNHTLFNNIRHPHFCPSCGRRVAQP
jgi:rubrerythrin